MLKNGRPGGFPGGILRVVLIDEVTTSGDALVGALRQRGREVLVERADQEETLVSLLQGFWPDVVFTVQQTGALGLPAILAAGASSWADCVRRAGSRPRHLLASTTRNALLRR